VLIVTLKAFKETEMMATARSLVSLFNVFVVFFIFKKIMIKKFTIAFKNNFVKVFLCAPKIQK
jgi:hypothetical protein